MAKKEYKNNKFYTVASVVNSILSAEERGTELFNKYLLFAIEGLREIEMDHQLHDVSTFVGKMDSVKVLEWPDDMIDYSKLGIKCGELIKTFTRDHNIHRHFDLDEDQFRVENEKCEHILNIPVEQGTPIPFHYNNGLFGTGQYYGVPVHDNGVGYYQVDRKERLFIFSDNVDKDQEIIVEYITDGIDYTAHTVIHPYAYNAIRSYVMWQAAEFNDRIPIVQKERRHRIYNNAYHDLSLRKVDLSIEDIKEALRFGYSPVVNSA